MSDRSDVLWRRILIASGFVLFVLSGVRASFMEDPQLVDVFLSIAMCAIAVKFCIVDYRLRGRTLLRSYHWLIFFTWPFTLPVYLVCSRGIGKGIVAIMLALIGVCVASAMGWSIAYLVWSLSGN